MSLEAGPFGRPVNAVTPRRGRSLFSLALVLGMHALFFVLLIWGMSPPVRRQVPEKPVEVSFVPEKVRPPDVLPMPKLVAPQTANVAPPQIDIAVAPQSQLSPAQGTMPMAPGGSGNGNGGQGTRTIAAAPAKIEPPVDPNCETKAAYVERVRQTIDRYKIYSKTAQVMNMQGDITLHLVTDHSGKVLVYNVAGASVLRVYKGHTSTGGQLSVPVLFGRIGAQRWNYTAMVLHVSDSVSAGGAAPAGPDGAPSAPVNVRVATGRGSPVTVGQGSLAADANGVLSIDGMAAGSLFLLIPGGVVDSSPVHVTVKLGNAGELFMLENDARKGFEDAQPLPSMPDCLKLNGLNELLPVSFHMSG